VPRLTRHGATDADIKAMLIDNPARFFFAGA
jgi:predicted metal-dependent phosphotriesterase family hydrolase